MAKRKKEKVEYRYYEMPADSHILALLGEKWIQTYGRNVDYLHLHNYMEIGYCYYGTGELVLENTVHQFYEDTFSVIPTGVLHTTNSTPDTISRWEYLYLDVEGYVNELYRENSNYKAGFLSRINARPLFMDKEAYPRLGSMIRNIMEEMRQKEEYYKEKVTGMVFQLLAELARLNEPEIKGVRPVEQRDDLLSAAIRYIHIHYAEPIRVETLADICYISENHFRKIFRERVHMSPLEYINLTRIHAACDLLKKTADPIMDVAHRVGFPTLSTFNRNFKRYVGGVTPYEWRKRPEHYEQRLHDYWIQSEEGW